MRGGGGQGSLVGLPTALLFPDLETNDFLALGTVQAEADPDATSLWSSRADLEAFIIRYGLDADLPVDADARRAEGPDLPPARRTERHRV
jgi:hypothetical protein